MSVKVFIGGYYMTTFTYHHIGIPTDEPREGEKYSAKFKMYTTEGNNEHRIQWHRFEEGCSLHPLIQTVPHVAFKVDSIDEAIKEKRVILEPYYPFEGFRVAMVEVEGVPVEYIETDLNEEDIWNHDKHKNSIIYPDK